MSLVVKNQVYQGILYMLIASFCFALTGACARYLKEVNFIQLVLYRNIIGLGFIVYLLQKQPIKQKGGKPYLLLFRGMIGTLALYSFFYGVVNIGLAEAITYQQSYPIFLALLAMHFYQETLSKLQWLSIFIGFGGICFIFLPNILNSLYMLKTHTIGISNAVMTGLAYFSIRGLSEYYDKRVIVLSFLLCGILLPTISLSLGELNLFQKIDFFTAKWESPTQNQILPITILGVAALFGQIYLTKAFSFEKSGVIAAIGYSNIVFSIIFGILLGDPLPNKIALIGILLVIISGMIIGFSKRQKLEEN